jgi:hypothetical protein
MTNKKVTSNKIASEASNVLTNPNSSKITEDLNYFKKKDNRSISDYLECLKKISKKKINLSDTEFPIFLDTNILLRYYEISFLERKALYDFIEKFQKRIILTNQVQYEFLTNREKVIENYFEQITKNLPEKFRSDVINKIQSFLDNYKKVLMDYTIESELAKYKSKFETLLNDLNNDLEQKTKDYSNLLTEDSFLDLLNTCTLLDTLEDSEIKIVKEKFDLLKKDASIEESFLNKKNAVFPGWADIKKKPSEPYGDFIIFHEIMKYLCNEKTNAFFLTLDNTKGDWMSKTKSTYYHYVQNMYANTNQIVYILDAERILKDLDVNVDSLVNNSEASNNIMGEILSIKYINHLITDHGLNYETIVEKLRSTNSLTSFRDALSENTKTSKYTCMLKYSNYKDINKVREILKLTPYALTTLEIRDIQRWHADRKLPSVF